jgi:hypothetical protein
MAMAKGRKPMYQSEDEKPVMLSLRIPRNLEAKLKRYADIHRQSITEVVIDGIQMRLETPTDPRDMILSKDNTVIQELQEMIQTAVQAEIGKLPTFMGPHFSLPGGIPVPEAPAELVSEFSHDNHTVLQEIGEPEQGASPMPASQPKTPVPMVNTTPALSEDIVKIAEARRQQPDISERAFTQLLFDRGIYRHQTKDGSAVPLPHSTLRDWLQRAREAGVL